MLEKRCRYANSLIIYIKKNLFLLLRKGAGTPYTGVYRHKKALITSKWVNMLWIWVLNVHLLFQALGNHLADILVDESPDIYSVIDQVKEETKKKELRMVDDEEDFLDEGLKHLSFKESSYRFYIEHLN